MNPTPSSPPEGIDSASAWTVPQPFVDALTDPLYVKNRDNFICQHNVAYEDFFAPAQHKILNGREDHFAPAEVANVLQYRDLDVLTNGCSLRYDAVLPCPIGGPRNVVIHKRALRNTTGEITGMVGTIHDVTDVVRAETALKASQTRLQTILDATLTGILVIDASSRQIVSANQRALELMQRTSDEVLGQVCHEFVCAANKNRCPILDLGGSFDRSERTLMTASGTPIPILKTVRTFESSEGKFLVESFLDIRDLKATQAALEKANDTLRAIIETSPLAMLAVSTNGNLVIWNRAATRLFGWLPEEVLGHPNPVVPEEFVDEYGMVREKGAKGETITGLETLRKHKDGTLISVSVSTSPYESGETRGLLAIVEDISERKKHSLERERLITELTEALSNVKKLSGILPICMHCKKIRDDQGYWNQVEQYVREHSEAVFSHGLCPECYATHWGDDSKL